MVIRLIRVLALGVVCCGGLASGQTADEIVAKNIEARGGLERIKGITSLRTTGRLQAGGFTAEIVEEARAPGMRRQMLTVQGMTRIRAYDGRQAWQISPFEGRKDPERMGENGEQRDLVDDADFYGPLVDAAAKGNRVEYLGLATVEGDDALRLKVTLKNGDVVYSYLDPDAYLEIREERHQLIGGAVRQRVRSFGSYKRVNGVYLPFSIELTTTAAPNVRTVVTIERIEANVDIPDSRFMFPAAASSVPSRRRQ